MVGWAERSESHQEGMCQVPVGLASLGPPYGCLRNSSFRDLLIVKKKRSEL